MVPSVPLQVVGSVPTTPVIFGEEGSVKLIDVLSVVVQLVADNSTTKVL